jgi:hypothetical protein
MEFALLLHIAEITRKLLTTEEDSSRGIDSRAGWWLKNPARIKQLPSKVYL